MHRNEARGIVSGFEKVGSQNYKVANSMAPFKDKEEVLKLDKSVAPIIKELFRHHIK